MQTVYILLLEQNKYYVGITSNLENRLKEHFDQNSYHNKWISTYKPIKLFEQINNCDGFDENKYTLKYMSIYGMDNVRGGSYTRFDLMTDEKINITNEIDNACKKCYRCHNIGHFVSECNVNNRAQQVDI